MIFSIIKDPDPPWTFVDCMTEDALGHLHFLSRCNQRYGGAVDITLVLAQLLKLSNLTFVWSSTYGYKSTNGTWDGAVGDVIYGKVDSVVPQVSPIAGRMEAVTFPGYIFMDSLVCFAYCGSAGKWSSLHFDFNKIFASPLITAGLFFFSILCCLFILFISGHPPDIFRSIGHIVKSICCFEIFTKRSKLSFQEKTICGCLGIFLLFWFNFVNSKIVAIFTPGVSVPFKDPNGLADALMADKLKLIAGVRGDLFLMDLMSDWPRLKDAVIAHPEKVLYMSEGHGANRILRDSNIVVYQRSAVMEWRIKAYKKQHPSLKNVECTTGHACTGTVAIPDGYITSKDRPELHEILVKSTWRLRELGLVQKIENQYHLGRTKDVKLQSHKVPKLQLIIPTGKILACGLGVSLLAFVRERLLLTCTNC